MSVIDISLCDLKPDAELVIVRDDGTAVYTTARQLIGEARLPAFLTIRQVELCFSDAKGAADGKAN